MLKTTRLISVAAIAALALPALAGSWPPIAPRKAVNKEVAAAAPSKASAVTATQDGFEPIAGEAGWQLVQPRYAYANGKFVREGGTGAAPALAASPARTTDSFEETGGESGWQLAQHKYDFVGGRFVMSDECDHVIRAAQAATPADVERARIFSPGA